MKKHILSTILVLVLCLFSGQLNAQDGYTYTLVDNGGLSFTVAAVPNASTNNFATSVQSYGFTIIVPDGVTIDIPSISSLGGGADATFFNGTDVAQPTIDGYLVTETLGSPATLTAPSAGTNSNVFTFTVNGTPTSGEMKVLENNSPLANTITPLKSFMQADMIDNGMAEFVNVVDPNAAAVTAPSSIMFNTLSTPTVELVEVSVYPNPATEYINIKSPVSINTVELFDVLGKRVLTTNETEKINISQQPSGVYFLKIYSETASTTKKIMIE